MSKLNDAELDPIIELLEMDPTALDFDPQITLSMSLSWVLAMVSSLRSSGLEVGSKTAELCEQQTREQLRAMIRAVEPQLVAEMLQSFAREAAERAMGVTLSPLSSSGHDVTCKFIDELAEKQAQWAAHKALLWTAAQRPKNGVLQ